MTHIPADKTHLQFDEGLLSVTDIQPFDSSSYSYVFSR